MRGVGAFVVVVVGKEVGVFGGWAWSGIGFYIKELRVYYRVFGDVTFW